MKTLYLMIIAVTILLIPTMINNPVKAGCLLNSDWSGAPCYAIPGLNVTKEQMQKDWSGYYVYKGSQWMETKKIEMINATASGILKAWVCSSQSNYDAWWYYYLNGQAPSIAWPTNGPMCTIPPLQQLKVGAKIGEVECGYDLYLLVNKENGMPACVKLASITKLLGLGWEHLATYLDDTAPHSPITTKISITEQDFPSCKLCEGKSENLTVMIGTNNTVRWVNNTPSPVWFLTLPNDDDIAFSNSAIFPPSHIGAMKFPAYLYGGQSFEYTFTKPGKFFWHTNPQFMGWVTVLSETSENLIDTEKNGTLSGNVVLVGGPPDPSPQANYEVDVYTTDGVTIVGKTFTDDNAHYSIQLPAGNYIIYAPDNPTKHTYTVSVFLGKNTIFNILYGYGYR